LAPQGLDEALALLTQNGAVPLAGGTDLFLGMERRQTQPEAVVDLKRIPGMDGIEPSGRGLRIGALALMETLSASFLIRDGYPALGEAARVVGSSQTRNRATIGGNLANASPAADTATPLMALGAVVEATGADGTREREVDQLFRGPGKTTLRDGELLTAVLIPAMPALSGSSFQRCVRTAMDIAVVNCAAFLELDENGIVVDARIAMGAVGPTPLRAASAENCLKGHGFSARTAEEAAECAAADARPIDDVRAGADYRREMVRVLTRRAIESAFQRARGDA
jgi:carbon-monoxide dehydrogenase medium subunit